MKSNSNLFIFTELVYRSDENDQWLADWPYGLTATPLSVDLSDEHDQGWLYLYVIIENTGILMWY